MPGPAPDAGVHYGSDTVTVFCLEEPIPLYDLWDSLNCLDFRVYLHRGKRSERASFSLLLIAAPAKSYLQLDHSKN